MRKIPNTNLKKYNKTKNKTKQKKKKRKNLEKNKDSWVGPSPEIIIPITLGPESKLPLPQAYLELRILPDFVNIKTKTKTKT
jgi:hypothetical protein